MTAFYPMLQALRPTGSLCSLSLVVATLSPREVGYLFTGRRGYSVEDSMLSRCQAVELDDSLAAAHFNLAMTLRDRPAEMADSLKKALAAEPDQVAASLELADALRRIGKVEEARTVLNRLIATHPDETRAVERLKRLQTAHN